MPAIGNAACAFALAAYCLPPALFAATAAPGIGPNLVTEPVDATHLTALPQNRVAWATAENDLGEVAGDLLLSHLTIVLKRSAQQQAAFEELLKEQQDPKSTNFHHWLTPVEIGVKFGASAHDIDILTSWLQSQGLQVDSVAKSRTRIEFSGPAAKVGTAFASRLHGYLQNGEQRIAPDGEPQIPVALAGIVKSVSGLTTIKARSNHTAATVQRSGTPGSVLNPDGTFCSGNACAHYIFPGDFATIYDMLPTWQQGIVGNGQVIAIIGRARVYIPDIENFQSLSGLPIKDPAIVVGGISPGPALSSGGTSPADDDQLEATLDVTRATSVAPGATIGLVVSASSPTVDGVDIASAYVVENNLAQIMSISFSTCEAEAGQSYVGFLDELYSLAAAQGISVFVSSGDTGAAGCDSHTPPPPVSQSASPNANCASSYVTCVGGTEFADAANPSAYWNSSNGAGSESALGYIPEGAWNDPLNASGMSQAQASGGGVSGFIPTPSWQTGPGVPGTQGRYTPDVAFSASGREPYFLCFAAKGATCDSSSQFRFTGVAGTSASTPSMAGIAALLNQKMGSAQGNLNRVLYALAATPGNNVFHDVTVATSGVLGCSVATPSMCNNSTPGPAGLSGGLEGYIVGPGYDEVTGLGSIDVANLMAQWNSIAPAVSTLTIIPASTACGTNALCSGQTATVTATITGPGGGPIAGRQVRFDVVSGAFAIQSSDPANPLVSNLTVVSDHSGVARVIIQASAIALTQLALLRATDLTTGDQKTAEFTIVQTSVVAPVVAVEYYYTAWNFYFETAFPAEIAALDGGAFGGAWQRTGQTFNVWPQAVAGSSPTCRFFSTAFGARSAHFYTPYAAECLGLQTDPVLSSVWQLETPAAFYVALTDANGNCPAGLAPLYRVYNNGMGGAPNHRYTTNPLIRALMITLGWVPEGNGPDVIFACVP